MAKEDAEKKQAAEKVTASADLLKDKVSSIMSLVDDNDDELDEELMEELKKPKKKFFGLF
jgi:gas vesicle protein